MKNYDFRACEGEFSYLPNFFLLEMRRSKFPGRIYFVKPWFDAEPEPAQKITKRKKLLHMMLRPPNIRECVLFPRDMYRVEP